MSPASCGAGVLGPQVQEDRDFQSGYFRGGGSIYVRDGERRPASAFVEPRPESPDLRSLVDRSLPLGKTAETRTFGYARHR